MRRKRQSPGAALASSPTMVGAVTTLIVIVAVFLAYNANNGLPFVPVYRVSVEVPNAARVGNNNEIRIGGTRVGVVEAIVPITESGSTTVAADPASAAGLAGDTSTVAARLDLKLDKSAEPLPQDSIFRVRYRSSFGLKYVEVVRGTGPDAPEGFVFDGTDDGAVCELPHDPETFSAEIPEAARNGCFQFQTEFDAINDTFDSKTRQNSRHNLEGYGNAFAARGASLNEAFAELLPLFSNLRPVGRILSDPRTNLRRFFRGLARAAQYAAPVAREQAEQFAFAAIAFRAISADPEALKDAITEGVPALETGIRVLPAQQVFLHNLGTLAAELNPGARDLRATLPLLNEAIDIGTPVLRDSPPVNRRLRAALRELNQLVSQPSTRITLMRLGETFDYAKPLARYVVPAQTVCNYFNYWFTFLPGGITDRDQVGHAFRQTLVRFPSAPAVAEAGLGGYSGIGANGKAGLTGGGEFRPYELPIVNTHPYQPTGQRNADCQAGQASYPLGQIRVPGQSLADPANRKSNLPGSRGPTTLFYNDAGERELHDTRVTSRQPQSWKQVGR